MDGIIGSVYVNEEESEISECYNKATILKTNVETDAAVGYMGGITGCLNNAKINSSYNMGKIESTGKWIGGIVGSTAKESEIKNCYNKGEIIANVGMMDQGCMGGITGNTYYGMAYSGKICELNNCYNLGNIVNKSSVTNQWIGGIEGYMGSGYTTMNNCYNQANVSSTVETANIGGIIGRINNCPQITVTNCSTSTTTTIGANEATSSTITNVLGGQTNMPSLLSVINTDNEGVFVEDSKNINNGYPVLKWQIEH